MQAIKYLFLIGIFSIILDPWSATAVQLGPVSASLYDIILLVELGLLVLVMSRTNLPVNHLIVRLISLLLAALFFSSIHLFYVEKMVLDIKVALNLIKNIVLILVSFWVISDFRFLKKVIIAWLITTSVASSILVLFSVGITLPLQEITRATTYRLGPFLLGIKGTEGAMTLIVHGGLLLIALPFLMSGVIKSRSLKIALGSIFIISIIITLSRSMWLAAIAEMFAFFWLYNQYIAKKELKTVGYVIIIIIIMILAVESRALISDLIELRRATFEARTQAFAYGLKVISLDMTFFIFGIGKNDFVDITGGQVPHNLWLDFFYNGGLVATLFLGAFFFVLFRRLLPILQNDRYPLHDRMIGLSLMTALIGHMFYGLGTPIFNSCPFWALNAIICAYLARRAPRMPGPSVFAAVT